MLLSTVLNFLIIYFNIFHIVDGQYQWIPCRKFTHDDIIKYMELVRTQSFNGSSLRIRKHWHTEFPSIQGPWTPFTFRDPKLNITEIPHVSFKVVKYFVEFIYFYSFINIY